MDNPGPVLQFPAAWAGLLKRTFKVDVFSCPDSERLLPSETLSWYLAHLPAHAQVHVVDGFGHVPRLERPDELVSHLVRFADSAGL